MYFFFDLYSFLLSMKGLKKERLNKNYDLIIDNMKIFICILKYVMYKLYVFDLVLLILFVYLFKCVYC